MKQLKIITTIILLSLSGYTQTQQQKDSIAIIEQQKKIVEIVGKTSISEFNEWLYKNLLADKYNEFFAQWYNAFVNFKLSQLPKEDKKQQQPKK